MKLSYDLEIELDRLRAENASMADGMVALVTLHADEIARLRAENDLLQTALQHGSDAAASLRAENERLRGLLAEVVHIAFNQEANDATLALIYTTARAGG